MRLFFYFCLILLTSCEGMELREQQFELAGAAPCACTEKALADRERRAAWVGKGALLASRFESYEDFKSVVDIEFFKSKENDEGVYKNWSAVRLRHCGSDARVTSVLVSGLNQKDITDARDGDFFKRLDLLRRSPYTAANRKTLKDIYLMARWRPGIFKEGDVAFFDVAMRAVDNITTHDLAFRHPRDSSEKGYINTFNHFIAQAIITSCFSEELADFLADVHELKNMDALTHGNFTETQLTDPDNNAVDNYVDIINNEWGQELGKQLKQKYHIDEYTVWTPGFLANYLNDIQAYLSWSFQIGFEPYHHEDPVVRQFSYKMNKLLKPLK
jgi:hypothetical protein